MPQGMRLPNRRDHPLPTTQEIQPPLGKIITNDRAMGTEQQSSPTSPHNHLTRNLQLEKRRQLGPPTPPTRSLRRLKFSGLTEMVTCSPRPTLSKMCIHTEPLPPTNGIQSNGPEVDHISNKETLAHNLVHMEPP